MQEITTTFQSNVSAIQRDMAKLKQEVEDKRIVSQLCTLSLIHFLELFTAPLASFSQFDVISVIRVLAFCCILSILT